MNFDGWLATVIIILCLLQLINDYDKLGIQVLLAAPARKLYNIISYS